MPTTKANIPPELIEIEFLDLPQKGSIAKNWLYRADSRCTKSMPTKEKMRSSNSTDRLAFDAKNIINLGDAKSGEIIFLETYDIFHDQERVWRKTKVVGTDGNTGILKPRTRKKKDEL